MKEEPRRDSPAFRGLNPRLSPNGVSIAGSHKLNKPLIGRENENARNKYAFPASRERAEFHQFVNKYGYRSTHSEAVNERECACCGYTIKVEEVPMCASLTPLKESEAGLFPEPLEISADTYLYFHFAKMAIIYVLLRVLFCLGFKFLANANSQYCSLHPRQCDLKGLLLMLVWAETRYANEELLLIECFLNVVYLLVAVLFLVFYRCTQHSTYTNLTAKKYSQDDFTVLVENIPFFPFIQNQPFDKIETMPQYFELMRLIADNVTSAEVVQTNNPNIIVSEALRLFFNRQATKWRSKVERKGQDSTESLTPLELNFYDRIRSASSDLLAARPVKSVNLCFNMGDLEKVAELREQIMVQHSSNYRGEAYVDGKSKNYPPNQVNSLAEKEIEIQKHYATTSNPELTLTHFLGTAFVSFEYEEMKQFFIAEHGQNLKLLYDDQTCIRISEAPAPEEVSWYRLHLKDSERRTSLLKGVFLLLLIVGASLVGFKLIARWRLQAGISIITFGQQQRFEVTEQGVTYILVISIALKLFMQAVGKAIEYGVGEAGLRSGSGAMMAKTVQKVASYFVLTVFAFSIFSEFWTGKVRSLDEVCVTLMLLTANSLFMRMILNLLQFGMIIQSLKLQCFYSDETAPKFQVDLNKTFQLPPFDISEGVAYYVVWLLVVSFFSSVAAVSNLVLLVFFLANYWVDKWNLLRKNSNPVQVTKKMGYLMFTLMQLDLLVFALGNFVSMYHAEVPRLASRNHESNLNRAFHIHLNYRQTAAIGLAIAAVFVLVSALLSKTFGMKYKSKSKGYSEAEMFFGNRYWTENPATRLGEEGKYEAAKNQKMMRLDLVYRRNYSLPGVEMKPPKAGLEAEEWKADADKAKPNLEEIDLSRTYKVKGSDNPGTSRSSWRRQK